MGKSTTLQRSWTSHTRVKNQEKNHNQILDETDRIRH